MEIEPFKLRKEMRGSVLFEAARDCFGEPHQRSVSAATQGPTKTIMNWVVMDSLAQHIITIGYVDGADSIDLNWESQAFASDNTVCVNLKTYVPSWPRKVHDFIEGIKKPWDSWTEEELLRDPMWIYFFWRANGSIPESLHTAMVLSGGDNKYVKRYFQECQSSPPRSSPG